MLTDCVKSPSESVTPLSRIHCDSDHIGYYLTQQIGVTGPMLVNTVSGWWSHQGRGSVVATVDCLDCGYECVKNAYLRMWPYSAGFAATLSRSEIILTNTYPDADSVG